MRRQEIPLSYCAYTTGIKKIIRVDLNFSYVRYNIKLKTLIS